MIPELITMLTYNDETVPNAREIFEECSDLSCRYWGFKDIGLPKTEMIDLVNLMKEKGKTTFLEIVSLSEEECMAGARVAVECGFDYLMGTVFHEKVFNFIKEQNLKFLPFCGKVTGHPSVVEGTIQDTIADAVRLQEYGVDGFDLLAYRFVGDPEKLASQFLKEIKIPVVIAGSISSFQRLDKIKELNPWAFTIGTAFFDKKFVHEGSFREQMKKVIDYLRSN